MEMPDSKDPLVCVVVLHWKNYRSTRNTLRSLGQISYPNYKVLIVDNCSEDGSIEQLQAEFPGHAFLLNEENLGFSRGCNHGIRQAYSQGADYILLLNNDMKVEPDFLEPAVEMAHSNNRVGLVTGKILFGDRRNVIWHATGYIHALRIQGMSRAGNRVDGGEWDTACATNWGSGAMLLIPRKTIERVGLLPEEYFFGSEEWDYSTSVRRAGLKIMYVPNFKGYHYPGGSYKAGHPILIVYNGIRNKLIYAQKYLPPPVWLIWKLVFRCYLQVGYPRRAWWGCQTVEDQQARLRAARLAFAHHRGPFRIELSDLERAAKEIGPTPTWGEGWGPEESNERK